MEACNAQYAKRNAPWIPTGMASAVPSTGLYRGGYNETLASGLRLRGSGLRKSKREGGCIEQPHNLRERIGGADRLGA